MPSKSPFRTFDLTSPTEADFCDRLIEVVQTIRVTGHDVLVTRNAGLFTRPPDGQALITSASGARESYADRMMNPALDIVRGNGLQSLAHPSHPLEILERVGRLEKAKRLHAISPTIPTFVASAYALFSQRQLAEALASAWIVIEQVIDRRWRAYLNAARGGARPGRNARGGARQGNVNVNVDAAERIERLRAAGRLPTPLCVVLQEARRRRNRLMHRAVVVLDDARVVMRALHEVVGEICRQQSSPPECSSVLNW